MILSYCKAYAANYGMEDKKMKCSVSNKTVYSFNGACVAPSCRSAARNFVNAFCADTAFAVSVLFFLISAVIVSLALCIISLNICRLTMLAIILILAFKFKQAVNSLERS